MTIGDLLNIDKKFIRETRKKNASVFFILLTTAFFYSCKKDPAPPGDKTLILGKWQGVSRFEKHYYTTWNGQLEYVGDSAKSGENGSYFWVEFKNDTASYVSHLIFKNVVYDSLAAPYTFENKKLKFECSRFTTKYFYLNCVEPRSSIVKELTANSLVLYDRDTISVSPLGSKK